jgi:Cu/Ag efflux protein CusF
MRRLILTFVLTSGAGWVMAQDPQPQSPTQPAAQQPAQQQPQPAAAKDSKVTALVVATDMTVKTITVKKEAPGGGETQMETTLPVDEKALTSLKSIKTGDKVKLVLKTDSISGKESVTSIEKAKSATPEK